MIEAAVAPYLNSNARRGYGNLSPEMRAALAKMLMDMPPALRDSLIISDTGRDWQGQVAAAQRHGLDPMRGKPGVLAPWGKGRHHGTNATAVDFYKPRPDALRWMRENAANYGLAFPIANDPWHMEYKAAPSQGAAGPVAAAGPMPAPPTGAAPGSFRAAQDEGLPVSAPAPALPSFGSRMAGFWGDPSKDNTMLGQFLIGQK